mmetsp:Transcript_44354/g.118353  ORF Transcript_44354/g.118353 Transcript_44354/m.118353 type:complete len:221 (+) Transcript_44354:65-727(+)
MPTYKLTYFNFAGAAEKARLAFKLGGIEFEDERIEFSAWPELKPKTPYGQMPLLSIDGKAPVAQSGAILRYIGRIADLYPSDADKALEVDEVIGLDEDLMRSMGPSFTIARAPQALGHAADLPEEDRKALQVKLRAALAADEIPRFLGYFEAKLAKTGTGYFVGTKPTIADCVVLATLRALKSGWLDGIPTTLADSKPLLSAFYERMMAIPALKEYYAAK